MEVRMIVGLMAIASLVSACQNQNKFTTSSVQNAQSATPQCAQSAIKNEFIVKWTDGHYSVEKSENVDVFVEKFANPQSEKIDSIEYNYRVTLVEPTAKDVSAASVSGTTNPATDWGQTVTGADQVWSQNILGDGITVAVVDSGVDVYHKQISANVLTNPAECAASIDAGVDRDGNGIAGDCYGYDFANNSPHVEKVPSPHGTHVAGIIAADHTNGPMKGMAPKAKILATNFFTVDSQGNLGGDLGSAIKAMQYAVKRGARIVNASWGGGYCTTSLQSAISDLNSAGVMFVVAAGNDGQNIDNYASYPAGFAYPNQITVAASTVNDLQASYSDFSFNLVHLAAPGTDIYSTFPGNQYQYLSGTSMAAPVVSGAAALVWSARPNATVAQVRQALIQSVDSGPFAVISKGRLNVKKAVSWIQQNVSQ